MTSRPRLTPQMADARRAVRELLQLLDLAPNELLLAAVSGGGDSLALAAALAFEAPRHNLRAGAVIIDHQLQPGSAGVAQGARATCQKLGLDPVIVSPVNVNIEGQGLEAAAREARYSALEASRLKLGAGWVLLGHNLEDQAESVLLGLTRGSGLKSIAGMREVDSERRLLRPFLGLSRNDLRQACKDQDLDFFDDPHNQDPRFTRVKIRNLMAGLEQELGPGLSSALAKTAELASEADDFLLLEADRILQRARVSASAKSVSYSVRELEAADIALRNRSIALIAQRAGAKDVSRVQVQAVEQLISNWHGQKMLQLSGITVERVDDQLVFKTTKLSNPGAC